MGGQIRKLEDAKDFKEVYQVFSEAPYFEKYTEGKLGEIFKEYQEKGCIFGAYKDEKCIGLVALEKGIKKEHPVKFKEGEKVMYLADVAVLDSYRRTGLGTQLMTYAVMQSKALEYQKLYMRTLTPDKSMSYGIARKIGFEPMENVYQSVKRERMDGSIEAMQNVFLVLDLKELDKEVLKQSIRESILPEGRGRDDD